MFWGVQHLNELSQHFLPAYISLDASFCATQSWIAQVLGSATSVNWDQFTLVDGKAQLPNIPQPVKMNPASEASGIKI